MKNIVIERIMILLMLCYSFAQSDNFIPEGVEPDFIAELSIGFNYDYLQSPLDVSFDYPKGYFGINIPLKYTPPQGLTGSLTSELAGQFSDSAEFVPEAYAKQYPNTTIKVDIPIMGGVATFSNMQMMYFQYKNTLGIPNVKIDTIMQEENSEIGLFLRGILGVPVDLMIEWETMTFGYAYEVNDKFRFAFNLHRHTFKFDLKGKIDIDLLGYFFIKMDNDFFSGANPEEINYSMHNTIDGHYEAEAWTPTFAVKYWRASLISRFGMNTSPKGFLKAKYLVPFFIDPETFTIDSDLENFTYMIDNMDRFLNSETKSVEYSTNKRMTWKMPQAHTLSFDIVPEKLSLSYTKLFGNIEMKLYDPESDKLAKEDTSNYPDTLDFRFEASVDHIIMINVSLYNSFFNIGIYSMDFAFRDRKNLLSSIEALEKLKFGNGIMIPVLNGGILIGSKIQLLLELDLLPLTAFKTGIVYYF